MVGSIIPKELTLQKWLSLAEELQECAGNIPVSIMLWGGEPLLYSFFDDLANELHRRSIRLGIVTNGTLIDRHLKVLATCIDSIHISVDGMREAHNAVRGAGVFEKLHENLVMLNPIRRGQLTFLTTLTEVNLSVKGQLAELCHQMITLGPDAITLQPLMYLSSNEIKEFRNYCRTHFLCDYEQLQVWQRDDDREYLKLLRRELDILQTQQYPIPVTFTPHRYPAMEAELPHCEAPWTRVHIRYDGEVGFCTDYFNFSAGNVMETSLHEIFYGQKAELFRKAVAQNQLATCDHCPWRRQKLYNIVGE